MFFGQLAGWLGGHIPSIANPLGPSFWRSQRWKMLFCNESSAPSADAAQEEFSTSTNSRSSKSRRCLEWGKDNPKTLTIYIYIHMLVYMCIYICEKQYIYNIYIYMCVYDMFVLTHCCVLSRCEGRMSTKQNNEGRRRHSSLATWDLEITTWPVGAI